MVIGNSAVTIVSNKSNALPKELPTKWAWKDVDLDAWDLRFIARTIDRNMWEVKRPLEEIYD
jgi:hypothetical protein